MNLPETDQKPKHGPWNPGLESTIPHEYLPLLTLFRKEKSSIDIIIPQAQIEPLAAKLESVIPEKRRA